MTNPSQEELVSATAFRYITDAITREEALEMLKAKAATKAEREATVRKRGYPAYVTSAGWLGYSDEKVARLTREAVEAGFNHFKMKVGADRDSDLRRGKIIRSIIDDPQYLPTDRPPRDPSSPELIGKNAGPTGSVLMIDANQVWDVPQAIEYVKSLEDIKPWWVAYHALKALMLPATEVLTALPMAGLSKSPPLLTTFWDTLRSERPCAHTVSVLPPASMRTTAWCSSSFCRPRPSTCARSTRVVSPASAKC